METFISEDLELGPILDWINRKSIDSPDMTAHQGCEMAAACLRSEVVDESGELIRLTKFKDPCSGEDEDLFIEPMLLVDKCTRTLEEIYKRNKRRARRRGEMLRTDPPECEECFGGKPHIGYKDKVVNLGLRRMTVAKFREFLESSELLLRTKNLNISKKCKDGKEYLCFIVDYEKPEDFPEAITEQKFEYE